MVYTTLTPNQDGALAKNGPHGAEPCRTTRTNRIDDSTVEITSTLGKGDTYRVHLAANGLAQIQYNRGEELADDPNTTTVAYERRGETYVATNYEGGPMELPHLVLSVVRAGLATPATAERLSRRDHDHADRYRYAESESDPLTQYEIGLRVADWETHELEPVACSCKGWQFTKSTCKHMEQFEEDDDTEHDHTEQGVAEV